VRLPTRAAQRSDKPGVSCDESAVQFAGCGHVERIVNRDRRGIRDFESQSGERLDRDQRQRNRQAGQCIKRLPGISDAAAEPDRKVAQ
jgi:hypothetical protein